MQDVANKHRRAIAVKVMQQTCFAARLFGGMDHPTAAELLGRKITFKCTCDTNKPSNRKHVLNELQFIDTTGVTL